MTDTASSTNVEIYVDGAFYEGRIGYGVVILRGGEVVAELSGPAPAEMDSAIRQVAGELAATMQAMNWCIQNGVSEATVYFDYNGIQMWATGQWKTNTPDTRAYAAFMRACPVRVKWQKVAAHTGVQWNERADQLAKQGASGGAGAPKALPAAVPDGLIEEADRLGRAFAAFLTEHGIAAGYKGILNNMYSRVALRVGGFVDIYNTPKKRRHLSLNGVKSPTSERVTALWEAFIAGR